MPFALGIGIALNVLLIIVSLNDGRTLSLSMFAPTADAGQAAARAFEQGDLDTAIERARAALEADPQNTAAVLTLARALVYRSYVDFDHTDDLDTAQEITASAIAAAPDDPDALAARAFVLQAVGNTIGAVEQAERALGADPNHTMARTAYALAYARAGSYDRALAESEAALATGPTGSEKLDANRALAISQADLGRYADAGETLDTLIADYAGFIPLYYERALYARQISNPDAAENAYLRVLALDPGNIKAQLRLCELSESIGEQESGLINCQQITQAAPSLPEGWYRLGRVHFLAGNFPEAQQALNRCTSLQVMQNVPPEQRLLECWFVQGQAAEITGDCPALIAVYNQFQLMTDGTDIQQRWVYPPEGPPMCTGTGE
ncbi:MAG: tetratricopeptide repeat protein [Chloroflexota bacterium]